MSEPCNGLTSGEGTGQGQGQRDTPRFLVGCEDDEQHLGQTEASMKNEMFREEELEDDDDESVSNRCTHS